LKSPIGNSLSVSIPAVCAHAVKVAIRLEWIARREMAKWRHQALAAVPANGAEEVSRLAVTSSAHSTSARSPDAAARNSVSKLVRA
jgi:hypothetical protein